MEPRYYHVLVFGDGQQDKLVSYGEDRAKAAQDLTDMIQLGGPDGIVRVIFVGTKKLVEIKSVFPKAFHEAAAKSAIANTENEKAVQLATNREHVLDKFANLQKEAEAVGIDFAQTVAPVVPSNAIPESVAKALQDNGIDPNAPDLSAAIAAKLTPTTEPSGTGNLDAGTDAATAKAKGTKAKGKDAPADATTAADASETPAPAGDLLAGT